MNQRVQVGARFRSQLLAPDRCSSTRRGPSTMTHAGLPEPASNAPAQTKRDALRALRLCRWPPSGLACVPRGLRLWATAFRERLLQPGQLAVLEPQSETVREGRGIHGQILHPQVDQVVGCLEAAVPSDIDGSEPDCRRGEPVLGTWAVGEESIPIRHQRHPLNFRTFRIRLWIVARSRLRVADPVGVAHLNRCAWFVGDQTAGSPCGSGKQCPHNVTGRAVESSRLPVCSAGSASPTTRRGMQVPLAGR